jgi:hypothetical protein
VNSSSPQNPAKEEQKQEPEPEPPGLTIFGIPIPRIPFNLSFGLAPTLSQGLIPLSIGRKGDGPSDSDLIDSKTRIATKKKKKQQPPKPQRGPDILDPIWVETGLKAAEFYLRNRNRQQQKLQGKIPEPITATVIIPSNTHKSLVLSN